ncbi:hypothetical protein SAMN04487764_0121 [Gillisia sp. Hel1_33_143]|uniref:GNAT family N-acetyltransferase n=1 Tax=Gillisia sp. Hel1_33_143 TaxID=1336796 RepID=UPI00087B98BD|nr:GNAT family N-acetyltransferase [Gillisia sp. Hel1_33_143]SDR67009.1 hypothetical protein SAMN04487764_0121 [Gillisia sp. Hel1_33_143]
MSNKINHKETDGQGMFFIEDDNGIISQLTYSLQNNGIMALDHTETVEQRKGEGLATKLVKESVSYAKKNDLMIDPVCPFAEEEFDKNKEYQEVRVN